VVVQEILIKTDNVEYKKEVFYSASEKRTYVGELPPGIVGEFGPGIRSLVCTLKYVANMSQPKMQELLENCGILISQATISRILTNDEAGFNQEKKDIFRAALEHTPFQQINDTTSDAGTTAKDAFLTVTQTAKKLGVNAFNYINDRVSRKFKMPALSDLIIENAMPQPG